MLSSRDWRVQLGALAVQYFAAFWLVSRHQPIAMASVKLVTGWMVVAAIGMTRLGLSRVEEAEGPFGSRGRWFSVILVGIVAMVTVGATARIEAAVPGMGVQVIAGGLLLIGTGLIHLGITSDVFRVTLALLTLLTGFEIVYAAVESSILVGGFLTIINLGLGLAGSYMLTAGPPVNADENKEDLA
jgi:hypothetical protein